MPGEILVLVTCPQSESERLAATVVEEHLAACVNIMPSVQSIYLWQGNLCREKEDLLIIKSTNTAWLPLSTRIKELHSYDVPEIISLAIEQGSPPYLDWLSGSVRPTSGSNKG